MIKKTLDKWEQNRLCKSDFGLFVGHSKYSQKCIQQLQPFI